MVQSAKCKVHCLWRNVFHFDGLMCDEHLLNVSVSFSFFFLYIYFLSLTAVLFSYFFTGVPMPCELEIWVLELLMTYAPAKICRDFYKKVLACHLKFSEYFKIKCYQTCRGLYSFVLSLSSPRKTRTDASQTLFTGWMCVPHSPPMA